MKDTIIKETGNSRFLRSSVAEDITFGEFIALLRAGQLPIDLAGINEEGIETLGMLLGKDTLLDDETETAIWGSPEDRKPTEALKAIVTNFLAALAGKITTGTYTGNGEASRTISLGFTPKAVIVYAKNISNRFSHLSNEDFYGPCVATTELPQTNFSGNTIVSVTTGGFVVTSREAVSGTTDYSFSNQKDIVFGYIAIA